MCKSDGTPMLFIKLATLPPVWNLPPFDLQLLACFALDVVLINCTVLENALPPTGALCWWCLPLKAPCWHYLRQCWSWTISKLGLGHWRSCQAWTIIPLTVSEVFFCSHVTHHIVNQALFNYIHTGTLLYALLTDVWHTCATLCNVYNCSAHSLSWSWIVRFFQMCFFLDTATVQLLWNNISSQRNILRLCYAKGAIG